MLFIPFLDLISAAKCQTRETLLLYRIFEGKFETCQSSMSIHPQTQIYPVDIFAETKIFCIDYIRQQSRSVSEDEDVVVEEAVDDIQNQQAGITKNIGIKLGAAATTFLIGTIFVGLYLASCGGDDGFKIRSEGSLWGVVGVLLDIGAIASTVKSCCHIRRNRQYLWSRFGDQEQAGLLQSSNPLDPDNINKIKFTAPPQIRLYKDNDDLTFMQQVVVTP